MQPPPSLSVNSLHQDLRRFSLGTHLRQLDWLLMYAAQTGKTDELRQALASSPALAEIIAKIAPQVESLSALTQEALGMVREKAPELFPEPTIAELNEAIRRYSRTPFQRVAERISRDEILIVPKKSKIEWDMERLNLKKEEVLNLYYEGAEDAERILASHVWQQKILSKLPALFHPTQIVPHREVSPERLAGAKLVIALGGDDHQKFVAQSLNGDTALLGLNSDSPRSYGALLAEDGENLEEVLKRLADGQYFFEPWTRLIARCGGITLRPAQGDFFIGHSFRASTSRHSLIVEGGGISPLLGPAFPVEQKGSGLLITTGSGSTGWPESGGRYLLERGIPFAPWARCARFILTEASSTIPGLRLSEGVIPFAQGLLLEGQKLKITSLNRAQGELVADSLDKVSFKRGMAATIEIDPNPLWVVHFKNRLPEKTESLSDW